MDVDCLKCINSACCKVTVSVSREEYEQFEDKTKLVKQVDKFLEKFPKRKKHKEQLDEMYEENYAEIKQTESGYCVFLGADMLCSIYEKRPRACQVYETSKCEDIRCMS